MPPDSPSRRPARPLPFFTLIEPVPVRSRFTLIELLVVIAIIAVLAAMLLPVLGKARAVAKRTADINNTRQTAMGFILYADDNGDFMADGEYNSGLGKPVLGTNLFFRPDWTGYSYFDLRPVARDYGFMAATAHPVTGAPAWDDPGNTGYVVGFGTRLQYGRRYHPTSHYDELTATEKRSAAPDQITRGSARDTLVSSFLNFDPTGFRYGPYVQNGTGPSTLTGNPSAIVYKGVTPTILVGAGLDGAVGVVLANRALRITSSNSWGNYYYEPPK